METTNSFSTGITGHELTDRLSEVVAPLGKVAVWEHTGGNCGAVGIGNSETYYRADEGPFLMITGPDVYSFNGDGQNPISDTYEEQWDHFTIGYYSPDPDNPDDDDWACEWRHFHIIDGDGFGAGLEQLTTAVTEWATSGSITGWQSDNQ